MGQCYNSGCRINNLSPWGWELLGLEKHGLNIDTYSHCSRGHCFTGQYVGCECDELGLIDYIAIVGLVCVASGLSVCKLLQKQLQLGLLKGIWAHLQWAKCRGMGLAPGCKVGWHGERGRRACFRAPRCPVLCSAALPKGRRVCGCGSLRNGKRLTVTSESWHRSCFSVWPGSLRDL